MAADVFAAVVRNLQALSTETLENLVAVLPKFDFAVLVLTGDDLTTSRHIKTASPRDNVVFETGLFMGRIGRERTFSYMTKPRNQSFLPISPVSRCENSLEETSLMNFWRP